jgi:hypothetical protein
MILYTVGRTPWTGNQLVAKPLPTQDNTNTEETYIDIYALNPVFERAKTVHALDRAATVIGNQHIYLIVSFSKKGYVNVFVTAAYATVVVINFQAQGQ